MLRRGRETLSVPLSPLQRWADRSTGRCCWQGSEPIEFASRAGLARMVRPPASIDAAQADPSSSAGTVGAVAVDAAGHLAAATSTGGRAAQPRGRVGDSPIPGAGTWADDATAAVSATGEGEAFVVAGFAHLVDWAMRDGSNLNDAVKRAMAEVARRGGDGGAISVTATGEVLSAFDTKAMARGWRDSAQTSVAVLGASRAIHGR